MGSGVEHGRVEHGRVLLSRRGLLRAGALIVVAGPLVAACTSQPPPAAPDVLQPMLDAATTDADRAKAASAAFADNAATLGVIAAVRRQQAGALRTEVDRAAALTTPPPTPSGSAAPKPTDEGTVTTELLAGLAAAQREAARLMPTLPRYRAGLVGSVAAGCASLTEALNSTPITATSSISAPTTSSAPTTARAGVTTRGLADDTATALQQALSTEHAALWLYGTASAFVTGSATAEIIASLGTVQNLRDAAEHRLSAAGVPPQPAQPAYLVPKPVTNQSSALAALAIAESDATMAWRSVLEHTDDAGLRAVALAALTDSAVRQTRWRRLSGQSPASVALPGTAA
ncbi:MAG TPA: ferritin-like domain-containing protein [Pseudonocardiaceae bacterium]|nr:ferritin-like domain-containing protein [Pseudonocardiaceae bacterium]